MGLFGGGGGSLFGGSGSGWGTLAEIAIPLAVNLFGAHQQSKMMRDVQRKEDRRWDEYMNNLNPPKDVLDTRFAQAKEAIISSAPAARRRLDSRLASRGIKGKGAVSPITQHEGSIQDALNRAYFNTYNNYNVPNQPGPATPNPSTGQLFGINSAQAFNNLYPYYIVGKYGG